MPPVGIVGGGIGGLSTAITLRRRGIEAEVYEATEAFRPVGSGIGLASNAMQVLDRMGLADAVSEKGWTLERARFQDVSGAVLGDYGFGPVEERFGYATTVLRRAELHEVLVDGVPSDALHLNTECTELARDDDRVTVQFRDGSAVDVDLVVGADGLRSTVREQLFPDARPRYAGQLSYRGISETGLPDSLRRTGVETWGRGIRFGFSPLGPEHVYWFAVFSAPPDDFCESGQRRETLVERYRDFPDPIPEIIGNTDEGEIIHTDHRDLPPLERWFTGRVVLVGDAAHAATPDMGQGAAQALEDAYALAECLEDHEGHREAFASYQRIRMPKARMIARRSRQWARMTHLRNRVLVSARNGLLRIVPESVMRRQWEQVCALDF